MRIKNLFAVVVFLLLASPVFGQEMTLFLTDQDGNPKTQFETGDDIYLEGACPIAESGVSKIYITNDETWEDGDAIYDVSSGIETVLMNDEQVVRTKVWKTPLNKGTYDVVIDINNNYTLQGYEYCILGKTGAGFRVGNPTPVSTPTPTPTPTPVSTPTPTPTPKLLPPPPPPPLSQPSDDFSLGAYVEVKNLANVRKSPGGALLGEQIGGAGGVIVGGPVRASLGGAGYWFWNVDFDEDPDGWVAESVLKNAPAPEPEPTPEPTPEPEPVVDETVVEEEPLADEAAPVEEQTAAAQVSGSGDGVGMNSFVGAGIIGLAILFGLIFGSFVIARALRKSQP